jgi:DNA-directed RNA polymerase subunit RPC12/RpoP
MAPYRQTLCQDEGFSKGMMLIAPIDLRKKYYFCPHCQKEHLVKDGLITKKNVQNIDYQERSVNPRICVHCGKTHDLILEDWETKERFLEADICIHCLMQRWSRGNQI